MKKKLVSILVIALLVVGASFTLASAQGSTNQSWSSAIKYFNTSSSAGGMVVTYWDGTNSYDSANISLAAYQSGTLLVNTVSSVPTNFKGSAVVSSDVPIAVVYQEFVSGAEMDNYDQSLYNGFNASQASKTFYVPTVIRNKFSYQYTSRVGIQNVDASNATNATLEFFAAGSTTPTHDLTVSIQPQASYVFSLSDFTTAEIPDGFTGALKITSDVANIVAASEETSGNKRAAYAFEGVATGEAKVYVPTMLCRYGTRSQISYYAVQAVGGEANVEIKNYDRTTGNQVGTTFTATIADGSKVSTNPCKHSVPDGSIGSSVIESTGGDVIVIVKVAGSDGMRTAYIATGTGSTNVALPYINWSGVKTDDYRTFVAVQNIGTANATDVTATYYNADGTILGTHDLDGGGSIAPLQKVNTKPTLAGLSASSDYAGAVVITSDQPVLVTVRAARDTLGLEADAGQFAEDYTGIPFTP